jgi:hypothetical protein
VKRDLQIWLAKEYFPHLLSPHALECIQAILRAAGIPFAE